MRKYLFVLAVLFLISFSVAQPPFQQTIIISKGIQLESPVIVNHESNQFFQFHIHAHNSTDGLLLMNDTTNCTIHIFSPSDGEHVIEELMEFSMNGLDFNFNVSGGNFTEIGQYSVLFYCEIPGEIGGFFEYNFDITATGVSLSLWDSLIRVFLIIFFIVLLAGLYHVVGGVNFERWNNSIIEKYKNKNFVKLVLSALFYNIMNNVFIIYYLIGYPIILIIANLTYVYNIEGFIAIMNVLLYIYTIGIIIVGIVWLSYVQEWAAKMWELVKDMNWGID